MNVDENTRLIGVYLRLSAAIRFFFQRAMVAVLTADVAARSSEGAALAVAPARQVIFGGNLLCFVVARRRPLGEAAFLQPLQEAASAARFEHEFLLFGQLLGGLEALTGNRRLARPDVQPEVAERREIAGRDGAPLADLNLGADAGGFHFGALAVQTGQLSNLLFVPNLLEFELDAAPVEGLFEGESEGLHRFTACTCACAGTTSRRAANCSRRDRVSGSGELAR